MNQSGAGGGVVAVQLCIVRGKFTLDQKSDECSSIAQMNTTQLALS